MVGRYGASAWPYPIVISTIEAFVSNLSTLYSITVLTVMQSLC